MSLNAILAGMGSPIEDAARQARSFSDLQSLSDKQVASERARIQYMRNEEARRRQMEAVAGPEDLAGGTPGQMVDMPTASSAAAPTFTSTPVSDIQKSQYIARNVTPAVAPNQSNAESARLASKAPRKPGILEQVAAVTTMPGALAVGPSQYMTDADRYAELRKLNPATATGGNESMAEANRINANRVPATAPTAAAPASADFNALAQAVKMVESAGDPNAVSSKGAVGTMQTMPGTLRDPGYGVRPAQNNTPAELERVGRDYLQAMIAKYPGNLSHALAAYNWGPGNTDKWIAAGADPAKLPKETRDYIPKVMARLGGQAPQTAAAAAPTAGMPTQAAAPAQAPAAPDMAFSPEQVTRIAATAQQDLRIKQLQLAEINNQLSYAPDLATATKLREQANQIRFGAYQAQLVNATAQAVGGSEQAMAQLANAARVQYAQTDQGYVAVAMGPDGQYRATTPPMPRERFINTLYSEATGAAQKARAEQAAAAAKASGDIAVKQQEGVNAIAKVRAEAEAAKQKFILEYGLTQNDVSAIEFDPIRGTPYMRTKGGVFALQPSQEVNGMQTEAKWVPIPS
jgi:soluble lytic murein transglycosylase-like protein